VSYPGEFEKKEQKMLENQPIHSQTIAEIAKALAAAQGEMEGAKKSSVNPHFKSKYADLSEVWATLRDVLPRHGLSVVQSVVVNGTQTMLVSTLLHTSGEWFKSYFPIMADKLTSQGVGSATSYARRYSLAALCGVTQEDDDGNIATQQQTSRAHPVQQVTEEQIQSFVSILSVCSDEYRKKVTDFLKDKGIENMLHLSTKMYDVLYQKACAERDKQIAVEQERIDSGSEVF
jgi:hypothetical protein